MLLQHRGIIIFLIVVVLFMPQIYKVYRIYSLYRLNIFKILFQTLKKLVYKRFDSKKF